MEIKRNGSQPSRKGPADWFTGTVRIDPLFQANAPARDDQYRRRVAQLAYEGEGGPELAYRFEWLMK
jgi:hypothetical protein